MEPPSEAETPGPELVGQTLAGRYRIVQMLGEGAMGSVYLGEHLRIGRRDAIKVLRASLSQDQEAIARFSRGAQNASRVRHPNVCSIYDFGETADGSAFLAMEYIEGESLQELLARQGSLPLVECVDIVRQVAGALQAAHDAGIVHRDLKPGNIMVTSGRGGQRVMKVVDFDIAKGSSEGEPSDLTRMGFVIGTPEYMSPEQLTADRLDGRSDVYSLGMVLFRMLTGVLPFSARSTREVMLQRLTAAPGKLAAAAPETTFPDGLQDVLDRALARDPEYRFPDAETFANTLAETVGSDRSTTRPAHPGPAPVARPPNGSAPRQAGAAAPVPETQVAPQRAPVSAPKSTRRWVPVGVGAVVLAVAAGSWALFGGSTGAEARLNLLPDQASIGAGDLLQISAEVAEAGSQARPADQVVWTSSDLAVATVSSSGLVTGVAPGTTSITASSGDLSATSEVSVASTVSAADDTSGEGTVRDDDPVPAGLDLETAMITFASASGGPDPEPRSVSVDGTGISGLDARVDYAGAASGWLDATLSTGQTPARLTLRVDGASVPEGLHEASVALSSSAGVTASVRVMFEKRSADGSGQAGGGRTGGDPAGPTFDDVDAVLDRQVNRLLDGPGPTVLSAARDTAQMVWGLEGAASASRAQAAFVIAQAELLAGDQAAALTWAERAVELAPGNDGYQRLLAGLRGDRR